MSKVRISLQGVNPFRSWRPMPDEADKFTSATSLVTKTISSVKRFRPGGIVDLTCRRLRHPRTC